MIQDFQLRDCQAWREDNLPLSTTSNEAAKLFDLALHQYVGWYDHPKTDGVKGALSSLAQIDGDWIMAKVLTLGGEVMGTDKNLTADSPIVKKISDLRNEVEHKNLPTWEKLHVKALGECAKGRIYRAAQMWDSILVDYPRDILSTKMAHDAYFFLGKFDLLRDSAARVIPHYKRSSPYYGYLNSLYAFGLQETHFYREAEKCAWESLQINRNDGWASHALAHIMEMDARIEEVETFLANTKDDWTVNKYLASHIYWHWCLSLVDQGRFDEALQIFDNSLRDLVSSSRILSLIDTTSLLYRLQLEGVDVGDRWQFMYEFCRPHIEENHVRVFNDLHFLFTMSGLKRFDLIEKHRKSVQEYVENNNNDFSVVCREVGLQLYEGVQAYAMGDYEKTIELILPIRHEIKEIGSSDTQRDLFLQVLIHAAMESPNKERRNLARSLLYERKAFRAGSTLTDRLLSKLLATHCASE